MTVPLLASRTQVEMHFVRVEEALEEVVDPGAKVRVSADWDMAPVVAGLGGLGSELISRNRGARSAVSPLLHLHRGLWAWLGYREEWDEEKPKGKHRQFSFRSAGITIHFGFKNDAYKPQMFRAEWAGYAKWNGDTLAFQAGTAGHPHWQFDVLESLEEDGATETARLLMDLLREEPGEERDFLPRLALSDTRTLISSQKMSRIHFASAAAWWKPAPNDSQAHCPAKPVDIQMWVGRTVAYVTSELGRLQAA